MGNQYLSLFTMEYLSSVTAMVMAVNVITQIIKEVIIRNITGKRMPKMITLGAAFFVVGMQHISMFMKNGNTFNNSILELIFLIILNSFLVAGLSMGNYKIMGLTKDKQVKDMQSMMVDVNRSYEEE